MTLETNNNIKVSIIVPTKNNGNIIARCLDSIRGWIIQKIKGGAEKRIGFDVIECHEFPYFSCFSSCNIMCEDLCDEKPFFQKESFTKEKL